MSATAAGGRRRVAVLRALGLGDLLTGLPALRALRDAFPDHALALAAPAALAPLVGLANCVDELHGAGGGPGRPVPAALPAALHGADVAVNLHGRGPQSTALLRATGPRRLIAYDQDGGPRWRDGEHDAARWCRLLAEHGIPADPGRLELAAPDRPVPDEARGATLVHPGAAGPVRRWPAERWAAVVAAEARAGRAVLVTGAGEEAELARAVAAQAGVPDAARLAGRTDALELAALVAAAGRVVCADTGLGHLATALGTPSVVLFGPVSPAEWGPPPDRPRHRALWAGRRGDPLAREPDPGLLAIGAGEVVAALAALPPARG